MNKKHTAIFFILLSMIVYGVAKAELNLSLPKNNLPIVEGTSFSSPAATFKERTIGLSILRKLRSQGRIIEDPEINIWVRSLGNKLVTRAPSSPSPFYFVVSKETSVNAFATLGGVIVVNAGLILNTSSESELASVIAHEIAHVTQRHIPRMIEKAESNKFVTGAALLAGMIAASKNSEAGQAIINTTLATTAHRQLSFSREAESEADRVGLRVLANAGFNPMAMPAFLQKLERYNDNNSEIREFLQNHPLTIKRVSDTFARASRYGKRNTRDQTGYLYMREKIRAEVNANQIPPNALPVKVKNYSAALRAKKQRAYSIALNLLNNGQTIPEKILIAELLNEQQKFSQTITVLKPLLKIYPGNEAITLPLVQALMPVGRIIEAWKFINEVNMTEQTSIETLEVKQEVARYMGKTALAYHAAALKSIRHGRYKAADSQLRQAIKSPGASLNEIREMEELLKEIAQIKRK